MWIYVFIYSLCVMVVYLRLLDIHPRQTLEGKAVTKSAQGESRLQSHADFPQCSIMHSFLTYPLSHVHADF